MCDINFDQIKTASQRIAGIVHRTPVLHNQYFDERLNCHAHFKCENFQKTGSFKYRGASNAILSLESHLAAKGVITHSSGNHGQALALAARHKQIRATVVMPTTASASKRQATADYGANIVPCGPTLASRESTTAKILAETGATMVHPYSDPAVIAGQGSAAMELVEEVGELDMILAPVGGGGLLSGIAIAISAICPDVKVVGVEPAGADDAFQSMKAGTKVAIEQPQTVADGLLPSLGNLPYRCIERHVDQIATVTDDAIVDAMRTIWQRMKIMIEPSAAVPVAALITNKIEVAYKRE